MKNKALKITALALCAIFLFGTAGAAVRALAADGAHSKTENQTSIVTSDIPVSKDETVYVLTGPDGAVKKVIVSDWIKNAAGFADHSAGKDDSFIWDTQGNSIYYQGDIEKELPVSMAVTYQLDGKAISPDDLAGKSGRVTMRFDYTNQQYEYAEIDGKKEKFYVPFAMLTGMLLDNEVFSNVEVSRGKLINDGTRTVVVGIAFPGLQENLGVDPERLEIPDHMEITADVKNFALGMTVTLATNEIFSETDPDALGTGDLSGSLGELTEAMGQLMDGSSQLYDGLCTLLGKSGELVGGIQKLASGANTLKSGAGDLDAGVSQLQKGAAELSSGLNTLASNSASLNGGAAQVFSSLLSSANTQLAAAGLEVPALTISNYADVLNGVIASLDETAVYQQALATVTAAVEGQRSYITQQVTGAIRAEVTSQVTAAVQAQVSQQVTAAVRNQVMEQVISTATGMDKAAYDAAVAAGMVDEETKAAIESAIEEQMHMEAAAQLIEANTNAQMASETVQATIAANVETQMQSESVQGMVASNTELQVQKAIADNMASDAVQSQLAAASDGAKSVISLKAALDGYNSFYIGLQSYTSGVAQAASGASSLKAGADTLKDGSSRLYSGTSELYDGILTLKNGAPALVDGITQLRDGAMALSDGLKEFNEKGVQKLVDAVDGDVEGLLSRIRATVDVSKDYQSFSDAAGDLDGQVKFIYRTDSIGA